MLGRANAIDSASVRQILLTSARLADPWGGLGRGFARGRRRDARFRGAKGLVCAVSS